MKKSTKNITYNCLRLNNDVIITLTYLHHDNDFKAISKIECASDRQCDIGCSDDRGGYSWNRDLCPAKQEFNNKK